MSLFLMVLIFITVSNLILGGLALSRNVRSQVNRAFFLVVLFTTGWILFNFLAENVSSLMLLWNRLTFTAVVFLAPSFMYFAQVFGPRSLKFGTREVIQFLVLPIALGVGSLTRLIVSDVLVRADYVGITYGSGYGLFVLFFAVYILSGLLILLKQLFQSSGVRREQIKYLMIGMMASIVFAVTTNLIYPLLSGQHNLSKYGPLGVTFLVISATYAILKHRLMDIRLAIRELVLNGIILLLLGGILALLAILILHSSLTLTTTNVLLIALSEAFLVSFLFRWLDRFIRRITDRFLFQKDYTRRELLNNLGRVVSQSIELGELETKLISTLTDTLRAESVTFYLKDDIKKELLAYLSASQMVVYDELKRDLELEKDTSRKKSMENIGNLMREEGTAVYLPLLATNGIIGLIGLGEKKGAGAYTSNDLEALETLMYQAGVAVENATLYDEAQKFNQKLQSEVTAATTDLKIRNKRLTVLRQLDQIILNTLNVTDMAQKIVDLVSWEMGFVGASMVLLEEEKGTRYLKVGAISNIPNFKRGVANLPKPFQDYRIVWGHDPSNLFYRAVMERRPYATDNLRDLYVPPLTIDQANKLQEDTGVKNLVVYALSAKGNELGAIAFALHEPYQNMAQDDKELIESFMDEVGIAIESARLYSQLEQSNRNLLEANERLKQLDKMKDELVSVASHELRTPMTAIKSYLWMALHKHDDNLSPHQKMYLERAYISSDRMIDLVNDMLSASRLEGGRIELELKAFDVLPIIQDVIDQLRPKAAEKKLTLKLHVPKDDLPLGLIDEERFREVVVNLVGNSIKYTDKGTIDVTLEPAQFNGPDKQTNGGSYIWVHVTDTGRGLDPADMPRLFKKFSKLEQGSFTKTAETGGTGLGLYISRGLIELHGGTVWAESKGVGKGSVFSFSVKAVH